MCLVHLFSVAVASLQVFTEGDFVDGFYVQIFGYTTVRVNTPGGVGPRDVFGYDERRDAWDRAVRPYSAATNSEAHVRTFSWVETLGVLS